MITPLIEDAILLLKRLAEADGIKVTQLAESKGPANFLPRDEDETDGVAPLIYYYGYKALGSPDWFIERYNATTLHSDYAYGYSDYSTNWTNRATLTYNG